MKTILFELTGAEVSSGRDRVQYGEDLIKQLPDGHEGRNTWLLNYGIGEEAQRLRFSLGIDFNTETRAAGTVNPIASLSIGYDGKDERLGKWAQDKITGFVGTIIGKADYLTGCTQLGIVPKVDKDGKPAGAEWFDEGRVSISEYQPVTAEEVKSKENGGPNRDKPNLS